MEHESASHIHRNPRSDLLGVRHFSNSFLRILLYRYIYAVTLSSPSFFLPPYRVIREKRARLKDKDIVQIRDARENFFPSPITRIMKITVILRSSPRNARKYFFCNLGAIKKNFIPSFYIQYKRKKISFLRPQRLKKNVYNLCTIKTDGMTLNTRTEIFLTD